MNKKIKIVLVCLANNNLGDTIIADCTEYLIKKAAGFKKNKYEIFRYSIFLDDVSQIKYADAVIFAGGGLIKYQVEDFYTSIIEILAQAQKYNIPVLFNSVGVENYDYNDNRCLALKEAVNQECVKSISIRDDIDTFLNNYLTNKNLSVSSVFDPAVWSDKVYKKDLKPSAKAYIGLGVAREALFTDYGKNIDKQYMLDYWKNVALLLEEKGYKWKIFTNGAFLDEVFAKEVLAYIGHGEIMPRPLVANNLVKTINEFEAIIATRMHSNIVAYSLGITSIGLIWNDKLRMWGEKTGYPKRFIHPENLNAENTIAALESALKQGCSGANKIQKQSVIKPIKYFLNTYCKKQNTKKEVFDYKNKVIETAMGGIDNKHKNLNCLWEMERRTKSGCRIFEADVRVTPDLKAVCINGWSEQNAKLLSKDLNNKKGLPYAEYKKCKYEDYFPVTTFEQLCDFLGKHKKVRVILDVGLPPKDLTEDLFEDISATLNNYKINPQNTIIRLQRKRDVDLWKKQKYPCKIAYYLPESEEEGKLSEKQQAAIDYCKKEKIELISLLSKTYDDYIAKLLKENSLKSIVFTYTKTEDLIDAFKKGANYAGSFYYSAKYIEDLYT